MKARQRIIGALFALAIGLVPGFVLAQTPQSTVLQLNQQAMNFYANLQMDQAQQLLLQAEAMCRQYNVTGTPLARTYVNLGIVQAGGYQNNAAANDFFVRAFCQDARVTLDPMYGTDDIATLFKMAATQARKPQSCARTVAAAPPPPPPPPEQPQPARPAPVPAPQPRPSVTPAPGVVMTEVLRHAPVAQQTRLVPIPLFVEVNPNLETAKVIVSYRTLGETVFQKLPMNKYGSGWAATIDCKVLQTFDPAGVEYFISVLDSRDRILGTSGSEFVPHVVAIVPQMLASPPALPRASPPTKCIEECPPWNPDCNLNCRQMGDLCDADADCCAGMVCEDKACSPGEGDGASRNFKSHARFALMAGTGAGLINAGAVSPMNHVAPGSLEIGTGFAWDKFHGRFQLLINLTPDLMIGAGFRGDFAFDPDSAPLQPAGMLNLAYRLKGADNDRVELISMVGLGVGVFQHRVEFKDCQKYSIPESDDEHPQWEYGVGCNESVLQPDGQGGWIWDGTDAVDSFFFRRSGLLIVEAGLDFNFWFVDHFGCNIGVLLDILIPVKYDFALNVDIQSGPAWRF